jgi:hypothetical protein
MRGDLDGGAGQQDQKPRIRRSRRSRKEIEMRHTTRVTLHGLQLAVLITLAAGAAGCTAIASRMVTRFANRELSKSGSVKVIDGDMALFRQCLEARGGTCQGTASTALPQTAPLAGQVAPLRTGLSAPVATTVAALGPHHPAQAAASVLNHPFLQKITAVHNHLRGLPPSHPVQGFEAASTGSAESPETTLTLSSSLEEVGDFVDQVNQATASGAWRALSEQAEKQAAASAEAQQDARTAAFIRRYTEAYFENGKFVKVELDTKDLNTRINSYLSQNMSLFCNDPSRASQYCAPLEASLQDEVLKGVAKDPANQNFVLLALGTQGYVSREGVSRVFPGVQVTFDPVGARPVSVAKIDLTAVGTDLVWVFFQALFDAHEGLPAVSTATGVDLGANNKAFNLPVFDPSTGNVNEQDFQDVNTLSNEVGAAAGTAFDKVIRGLGPFSLNNEALEELLTAIVTVTVHNAAQKATWCWFSCNLDQQVEKAAANEKEKIRSDLSKGAKRIKLRLRLF